MDDAAIVALLPGGSFLPRPPEGYVVRLRTEVAGLMLPELDAIVERLGGKPIRMNLQATPRRRRSRADQAQRR